MKSGFIALVGRPNVGKSTLLNTLVNAKIAIVSDKAGTTRNTIRGIYNRKDVQLVFIDTPGIHKPSHELNTRMNKLAYSELMGCDVVYYLVDATQAFGKGDQLIVERLSKIEQPIFLLLNKTDALSKEAIGELLMQWSQRLHFAEIFPISALTGYNTSDLVETTLNYLSDGVAYYDTDAKTDASTSFQIKELIREKILYYTQQEIPHSVAIVLDEYKKSGNTINVSATIVVERSSQKGILIGAGGKMIKRIGTAARKDIETLLGDHLFLQLYVRVEKNWRDNPNKLYQLGYLDIDDE